jgi:hypothetical protein
VLLAVACNPFDERGTLTAHWATPVDSASVTMPVTARWCVGPSRLDLRATAGDTGLGIALYPVDSAMLAGAYPVTAPGGQLQVRPGAAVALRWRGKVVMDGWWGDSGTVTLEAGAVRGLAGSGDVRLVSGLGPDSVTTLTFEFRGVRVQNDASCDAQVLPVAVPVDSVTGLPRPGLD